jgi:ATP-binding cassette subfamily C exporter for protease/lipase
MALTVPPLLRQGFAQSKDALVAAAGFSLALNLLTLAMPIYTIQLYDRVLISGSGATLALVSIAAVAAIGASSLLEDIRARLFVSLGCRFDAHLAAPLFARLVEASVRSGGAARGQALRDLDTVRQTVTGGGVLALMDLPWTPIFIICCGLLNPLIGLLVLAGSAGMVGLAILNQSVVSGPLAESAERGEASYGFTDAVMRNGEVVQAMGMLPALMVGWTNLRFGLMHKQAVASSVNSKIASTVKFARYLLQIVIFGAGAWLVVQRQMSPGALFASSLLTTRALQPIDQIVGVWRQLVIGHAAMKRVEAAMAMPDRPSAMVLPNPAGKISVENLVYVPPGAKTPAVMNVSFGLEPGESLGVVGASAAGKSTLARLIVGAIRPTNGAVRMDGGEVYTWDREAFGHAVGYLPQDVELFDGTIKDNICRFRESGPEAVVAAARLAGAHDLILRLANGYDTVIGATGASLSGGQRQRIGLARAAFGSPRLVVLDEPNASLDGEGEDALMQMLARLKVSGVTVVMVVHKPSLLMRLDKVLVLNNGGLAGFGPTQDMLPIIAPGFAARPVVVASQPVVQPMAQPMGLRA